MNLQYAHTTLGLQATERKPEHPVDGRFLHRWSPRAFSATPVPRELIESMVEAARWAPSSINLQPWTFHIAIGTTATRAAWNEAVFPNNRTWSDKAPVLTFVVARRSMGPNPFSPPESPNDHAHFDTGAATLSFVLEGERHGLRSHTMGGIDRAKAKEILGLDDDHEVLVAIATGHPGDPANLSEGHRARERPSQRKPASQIAVIHA